MMDDHQGDLADIVGGSGGSVSGNSAASTSLTDLQYFPMNPLDYYHSQDHCDYANFGNPFTHLGDPLRTHTHVSGFETTAGGSYDYNPNANLVSMIVDDETTRDRRSSCNLFSSSNPNKLPAVSASCDPASASSVLVPRDDQVLSTSGSRFVEGQGVKRRKSQAKKVVCIPAPAPANTRHSGEVVPSDLWAWRKYGQKPIKGSPYPRGYYRCSSSKGCSARKQVERSRTDPTMLVITYTSEHNHPWPTQRNALAGSTRSNPTNKTTRKSPSSNNTQRPSTPYQDKKEITTAVLKEEPDQDLEMDEEFFGELGEIEPDPSDLFFTQGFSGDENKSLDPFRFYD